MVVIINIRWLRFLIFILLLILKLFTTLIEEVDNVDDELLIIVESKLEIMYFRLLKYEWWYISYFLNHIYLYSYFVD